VIETGQEGKPDGNVDLRLRRGNAEHLVQCKRWQAWSVGVAGLAMIAVVCAGCGQLRERVAPPRKPTSGALASSPAPASSAPVFQPHPQVVEPVAGAQAAVAAEPALVSVDSGGSYGALPQPVSLAVVRRELAEERSLTAPAANQARLAPDGLAIPPADAPPIVQAMIEAGNQIAHLPYRYGGGHNATFQDTAYDCSGSISYVFAAVGLLSSPVDSSQLMGWGDPRPGQWVTVYANVDHTFMIIAGLRFDTVALAETGDRWSTSPPDEPNLGSFAVRHPPGL